MKYVIIILALILSHSAHAQPITTPADFGEIDRDFKFPAPRQLEREVRPYEKVKRDQTLENIISDPRVVFSTYFGGNGYDCGYGLTSDSQGNIYWVGYTGSTNIPIMGNAYQTEKKGGHDALIAKFSPDGQPVWITYFGGDSVDVATACCMDSEENLIVIGKTGSDDFPTTAGDYNEWAEAFILKFDRDGNLIWSRCFGGTGFEAAYGVDVTSEDEIVIAGYTNSLDLPKKGDVFCDTLTYFDSQYTSILPDCFVTKFDKNGGLIWNTYFGRQAYEAAHACAVDPMDNIAVCGTFINAGNYRTKFPTSDDAFQPDSGGKTDGIVFMLTPDGQRKWATYFGGSQNDKIYDIEFDNFGNVYFCGWTGSCDFPVSPGAFITEYSRVSYGSCYIAKLSNSCDRIWATYFGGTDADNCHSLAIKDNLLAIAGVTQSVDFPYRNNPIFTIEEGKDWHHCFFSLFNLNGDFIWSTVFGGSSALAVEISALNNIIFTSYTEGFQHPVTANAFQINNPSVYPPYPVPVSSTIESFRMDLLSIAERKGVNNILIYPNPCTTNFNLTTQNYEQIEIIRITNIYGQTIEFSASQLNSNHVGIYLNCANGIYFLELEVSGEKIIKKFIVNK